MMAKKKTRVLWLTKDGQDIYLTDQPPQKTTALISRWTNDTYIYLDLSNTNICYNFCSREFETLCPALKLLPNTKYKVRLTNFKNGIKLEKIARKG